MEYRNGERVQWSGNGSHTRVPEGVAGIRYAHGTGDQERRYVYRNRGWGTGTRQREQPHSKYLARPFYLRTLFLLEETSACRKQSEKRILFRRFLKNIG